MPSARKRPALSHRIVFAPEARDDLRKLYLFIAERVGEARGLAYVERIGAHCRGFSEFPNRGTRRDDLAPGLRVTGFERRITIAFHVTIEVVAIDRILYGGRDLSAQFDKITDEMYVTDPNDKNNLYVYGSGTSSVRSAEELAGCSGLKPEEDPNTALFSIDVIKVPLKHPEQAEVDGAAYNGTRLVRTFPVATGQAM